MRSLGCGGALFLPAIILGALWLSARGTDPHGGIFILFGAAGAFVLALLWLLAMVWDRRVDARRQARERRIDELGDSVTPPEA